MCRAAATATDAHFNPRTPRGGATHTCEYIKDFFAHFNPRTPRGGATINSSGKRRTYARFQSTHPARGCDFLKNFSDFHAQISIHAPREGVRRVPENVIILPLRISIHAPREGVRRGRHKCKRVIFHFNPRTPRGGATWPAQMQARDFPFQSTHPARGCDLSCCSICGLCVISIHAPREGVRLDRTCALRSGCLFQSTHPARGCDIIDFFMRCKFVAFQSTHPARGCDQNCVKTDTIAQFCELSGNDTSRNLRFCSL